MDNVDQLVEFLKNLPSGKYVTAKELSKYFEVTDRTIRNYVKIANKRYNNIILTSKYGYCCEQNRDAIEFNQRNNFSKSIDSRRFFIVKEMFKNGSNGVDIFDIAETLFVSESTIKSDIAALNKVSIRYDLNIKQKQYIYFLEGTDRNKRKLMIDMMSSSYQSFDISMYMQNFLERIAIDELNSIVEQAFKKFNFEPNTYFLENFLLHLSIAIDRSNKVSSQELFENKKVNDDIVSHISKELFYKYGIQLLDNDIFELKALYETEINESVLNNYVDKKIDKVVKKALIEISQTYLLEFNDDKFINRLLIHIQNLYKRSINNVYSRNFNLLEIKTKYPVLFDMAIYLSFSLSENLNIEISDEEVAFLALHIGTFVQNQKKNNEKIETIIITQFYNSNEIYLKSRIQEIFKEDIIVGKVVDNISSLNENDLKNSELIISTSRSVEISSISPAIVYIKEFLFDDDINSINDELQKIKYNKFKQSLANFLPRLFPEELYFKVKNSMEKTDVLKMIEKEFMRVDFVNLNYYDLLTQRENMSDTSFPSGVAIPHTVKYSSKKTGILVMSFAKEISWGHNNISLLLGLSIDKDDSEEFNKVFPRIVEIVSENLNVRVLSNCSNNKEFIEKLTNMMLSDGYYLE